ncbi:MAG TPA: hypothetical protein VFY49_14830 [Myxococcota bacterium]|nr:hypothetical protein [Myxococcota bacterium]
MDQSLDEGSRLQPEDLARHHLPAIFTIYAFCCSNRFPVEAIGRTVDGTWSSTEIVTTERARQRKDETRAQFKARLAWLSGRD